MYILHSHCMQSYYDMRKIFAAAYIQCMHESQRQIKLRLNYVLLKTNNAVEPVKQDTISNITRTMVKIISLHLNCALTQKSVNRLLVTIINNFHCEIMLMFLTGFICIALLQHNNVKFLKRIIGRTCTTMPMTNNRIALGGCDYTFSLKNCTANCFSQ